MSDPLREAIEGVLRETADGRDTPRWRRIEAEATRRGFPSTRAFRSWCLVRRVEVREDSHRDTWVSPAEVDAAVERMPIVSRRASSARDSEFDDEIDHGRRR